MMDALLGVAAALAVLWLLLLALLRLAKPDETTLRQVLRPLPDVVRLVRRLASDPQVSRAVRLRLFLLLAYLAFPIDLVPDAIPVLG